jgi:putative phosphoribosyl transferase
METDQIATDAPGRRIVELLADMELDQVVIIALSPQAVRHAFEAAHRLGCEVDLLLVGRICAPGHPEEPIGSILDLDSPQLSIDEDLTRKFQIPPGFLDSERKRLVSEIARLHFMYLGDDDPASHDHAGKDVVLLDDGVDEPVLKAATDRFRDTGALSVHVVDVRSFDQPPIDDRTIAGLLREARRLHRRLH